jgi:predicted lysophospholipase L1 biosynthesis ABC-type transport system permease subunit
MINEQRDDSTGTFGYRHLERMAGWLLLATGLVVLIGYTGWEMVNEFFLNPEESVVATIRPDGTGGFTMYSTIPELAYRLGVGAVLGGFVVLLVSVGRESLTKYRTERYREVER